MSENDFLKDLCESKAGYTEVEVPLVLILSLAERVGRLNAMRDYAKAHKYNFSPNDLSIIGGFWMEEEKENDSVQGL